VQENPEAVDELRRKALTQFHPAVGGLHWLRLPCTLNSGEPGHVVLLRVEKSDAVHSIVDDGTWTRLTASNREMNAGEIADLHYRRGVRSAQRAGAGGPGASGDGDAWRRFGRARGLRSRQFRRAVAAHRPGRSR
jgi:ATP-dependent DNA helicase RecG